MQQNKQTPGRRRRETRNTSAQKQYASENDAGSASLASPSYPTTPSKSNAGTPVPRTEGANGRSAKNNRTRPKTTTSASPGPSQARRPTPPGSAPPEKIGAGAAFAGATFHASPAPGSLPMPSFLAKSPSVNPAAQLSQGFPTSESDSDSEDLPTPSKKFPGTRTAREESPLDFMFQADRDEKLRSRNAGSVSDGGGGPGPFAPPPQSQRPGSNGSYGMYDGRQQQQQQRTTPLRHDAYARREHPGSSAGMQPMHSPRFSTPYQDRLRAAQSPNASKPAQMSVNGGPQPPQARPTPPASEDRSEALKSFLWGNLRNVASPLANGAGASAQAPNLSQQWGPPTPQSSARAPVAGPQGSDLSALENDLRRVLKLDSPSASRLSNGQPPQL